MVSRGVADPTDRGLFHERVHELIITEAILIALVVLVAARQEQVWYKLGRLDGQMKGLQRLVRRFIHEGPERTDSANGGGD